MFTQPEIDRLIAAMTANGVTSLDLECDADSLRLELPIVVAPVTAAAPAPARRAPVKSRSIGRFAPRGVDDGLPALIIPTTVQSGDILGYISQGAVRVPVTAQASGRITTDAPSSGTVFGFGDEIFSMELAS